MDEQTTTTTPHRSDDDRAPRTPHGHVRTEHRHRSHTGTHETRAHAPARRHMSTNYELRMMWLRQTAMAR
eukprot:scaffold16363_cov114-Isochrysis_galbana.AAC.2